jgi:hypothetical protein
VTLIDTTDYIRPTTAATIAAVNLARVKVLITQGRLRSATIDGHRFVLRADAEAWARGEIPRLGPGGREIAALRRPRAPAPQAKRKAKRKR